MDDPAPRAPAQRVLAASPAALAARLGGAFAAWRREPRWRHGAAVAALALVVALRWFGAVTDPEPLPDELDYFRGFWAVAAGGSPYADSAFLYPPVVALAGAWGLEHLGTGAVLAAIRAANLLGVAVLVWCSLAWLGWSWRSRLLLAAAVACLAPPVRLGVLWGNLNLAVAGMIVLGLLVWRRRPVAAGLMLGASIAVKPLAPVAVVALLAHRPRSGGRRHLLAGGLAVAVAAGLMLGFPHFGAMLAVTEGDLVSGSVSLHRFPYLLGFDLNPFWLWSAVALGTVVLARRLPPIGGAHLLCLASAATLAATPLVWVHTLLLALPLQVLALEVAWRRRAEAWRWEPVFVLLAVAAIQLSKGATAIAGAPLAVQWLGALPPALAPAALTAYLLGTTEPF